MDNTFQAIICWKRMRNRENKNYRSVLFRSFPSCNRKFKKKKKKIEKIKKIQLWIHFKP